MHAKLAAIGHVAPLIAALFASSVFAAFANQPDTATAPPVTPPYVNGAVTLAMATDTDRSLNWSGYVARGDGFTSVTGSWVVPKVAAGDSLSADATWVGIGGVLSRNLIQAGTQALTDASGNVEYQAWMEGLPGDSIQVPLTVRPGDVISASLEEKRPGQWHIAIRNDTTGRAYDVMVAYDSSHSSAEWVEEMPTGNIFIPLDTFGKVSFFSASAVRNGISVTPVSADARALTMVNLEGDSLAVPSVLAKDGAGFSVARSDAAAYGVQYRSF